LPSIDAVMPWLHLVLEAWEDYKQTREREAQERGQEERQAKTLAEAGVEEEETGDAEDSEKDKKKKRKKRKHKK
jgi:hypothetical protein